MSDERIQKLFVENHIVHGFLMLWRKGELTYEQALVECIVTLARQNKELFEKIVKEAMENPAPPFLRR